MRPLKVNPPLLRKHLVDRRNKAISCCSGRFYSIFGTRYYFLSSRSMKSVSANDDFHRHLPQTEQQSRFALGESFAKNAARRCRSRRAGCRSNRIQNKSHGIGIEWHSVAKRLYDCRESRKFQTKRFSRMSFTIRAFLKHDLFYRDSISEKWKIRSISFG